MAGFAAARGVVTFILSQSFPANRSKREATAGHATAPGL